MQIKPVLQPISDHMHASVQRCRHEPASHLSAVGRTDIRQEKLRKIVNFQMTSDKDNVNVYLNKISIQKCG